MGANANAVFQAAESARAEAHDAGGDRVVVYSRTASTARVEIDIPEQQLT
jgi:hypothetical protein